LFGKVVIFKKTKINENGELSACFVSNINRVGRFIKKDISSYLRRGNWIEKRGKQASKKSNNSFIDLNYVFFSP
jgi:hypothetical protein